ncbi:MAG: hypothetical protein U1B78_07385 [Dehalococcoidia bacterium]|nr:hypothetical protein [Dehalococcoidia bacterium]
MTLSDVLVRAQRGEVARIEVRGDRLTVETKDGSEYDSRKEEGTSITGVLEDNGVEVGGSDGVVVDVRSSRGGVGGGILLVVAFLPAVAFATLIISAAYWVYQRAKPAGR